MADDIVTRLRQQVDECHGEWDMVQHSDCDCRCKQEAADEIERLRAEAIRLEEERRSMSLQLDLLWSQL